MRYSRANTCVPDRSARSAKAGRQDSAEPDHEAAAKGHDDGAAQVVVVVVAVGGGGIIGGTDDVLFLEGLGQEAVDAEDGAVERRDLVLGLEHAVVPRERGHEWRRPWRCRPPRTSQMVVKLRLGADPSRCQTSAHSGPTRREAARHDERVCQGG